MKKLVGISTENIKLNGKPYIGMNTDYIRFVERAGGHPVMIPIVEDLELIEGVIQ